jgi:uncharacterized protein YgiB involved in biofilm formation
MAHVTGGNENIQTMDVIGRGGFGIVYKVSSLTVPHWGGFEFAKR